MATRRERLDKFAKFDLANQLIEKQIKHQYAMQIV